MITFRSAIQNGRYGDIHGTHYDWWMFPVEVGNVNLTYSRYRLVPSMVNLFQLRVSFEILHNISIKVLI